MEIEFQNNPGVSVYAHPWSEPPEYPRQRNTISRIQRPLALDKMHSGCFLVSTVMNCILFICIHIIYMHYLLVMRCIFICLSHVYTVMRYSDCSFMEKQNRNVCINFN